MKKVWMIGLVLILSMTLISCGDKKEEEKETTQTEEKSEEKEKNNVTTCALTSEDGSVSIELKVGDGYEESEYSSETMRSFEKKAESISTQLNLSLRTESENEVAQSMIAEVDYLLSANTDEEMTEDILTISEGGKVWSYFNYSMEELEGCRIWTTLDNGGILACTVENIGEKPEQIDAEKLISTFLSSII